MANEQLIEGHFLSLLICAIFLVVFLNDPSSYDISNDHVFFFRVFKSIYRKKG